MATSRHAIFPDEALLEKDFGMHICPVADLLNHSFEPNAVLVPEWDVKEKAGYLTLRSLKEIAKDEQILISYGEHSNLSLAQRYGFVVEKNPHSCIPIIFNAEIMQESMQEKIAIITQNLKSPLKKLNGGYIYENRMESDLIPKLRVWMLSSAEISKLGLSQLIHLDLKQKISNSNEQLTMSFLQQTLSNKREVFGSTDYASEKAKLDKFATLDNYQLYNLYVLEEEEKRVLDKALTFINSKQK